VGDEGFTSKCLNKIAELRKKGTAIILISHNMHIILAFSSKIMLLNNAKHKIFENVSNGIREYRKLFDSDYRTGIRYLCQGNEMIKFYNVKVDRKELNPGDSFMFSTDYRSVIDYKEVEIDTTLFRDDLPGHDFQATNKAFDKIINLREGKHKLEIEIKNIPVNNTNALIGISIWSKNRTELLFWIRVKIKFRGIDDSIGRNFLNVYYELK
jgi:lipopolysaccharide transport system ATP-binding protein